MPKFLLPLAALCAALALPAAQAQTAAPADAASDPGAPAPADDSLFRALGGQPGIARLVADFGPRLATDPHMREFFHNVPQPHFQAMLAQQFCFVTGGGCVYTGRSIPELHHAMDISMADFNNLVEVLQASMDAQGIPFAVQNRFLARLAPMHREIVTTH